MANEKRVRNNNVQGTLSSTMNSTQATMNSDGLANLEAISSTEHAAIVIDPGRTAGAPEIVHVTAHTGSATSAIVARGREGTSARAHSSTEQWVHAPTRVDFPGTAGLILNRNAAQAITKNTVTGISWDDEDLDTDGFIAVPSTVATVPAGLSGVYSISLRVTASTGLNTDLRNFSQISAGGQGWRFPMETPEENVWTGSVTVALTSGDTVKGDLFLGSSGASVTGRLEMYKIAPRII